MVSGSYSQTPLAGADLKIGRRMPRARSRRGSRHLWDRWARVADRLRAAKRLALFLDFDGTLVPLRARPEEVWMDDSTRRVLGRLGRLRRVKVWIISGRRRADVEKRARVPSVGYLGLHGWERDGKIRFGGNAQKLLQRFRRQLAKRLNHLRQIWIEDKTYSLVVHYRGAASSAVRRAQAAVRELLGPLVSEVRLLKGKKVWEILPREIEGKGAAVRELLMELPGTTLSLYVGDDTTDESAFRVLRRGITVRVGKTRPTKARYRLRNPQEVRQFLETLEAEVT